MCVSVCVCECVCECVCRESSLGAVQVREGACPQETRVCVKVPGTQRLGETGAALAGFGAGSVETGRRLSHRQSCRALHWAGLPLRADLALRADLDLRADLPLRADLDLRGTLGLHGMSILEMRLDTGWVYYWKVNQCLT